MAKKPIAILSDAELRKIVDRRPPEVAALMKAALIRMRRLLPGATELVYDKKNSLVVGFCSSDRASTAINSLATYTKWINLYFFEGDSLPDPERLLKGSGRMVRSVRLSAAAELDRPAIKALVAAAAANANPPLAPTARRTIVLRQSTRRS